MVANHQPRSPANISPTVTAEADTPSRTAGPGPGGPVGEAPAERVVGRYSGWSRRGDRRRRGNSGVIRN